MPEQREQFRRRVEELVARFEGDVDRHECHFDGTPRG